MIRIVVRLALRLAFSADPRQRWRQACVIAGSFLAVTLLAGWLALLGFAGAAQDRRGARQPIVAADASDALLRMVVRAETWHDRQFPVIWIEPAGRGEAAAVPPGLTALPEPGTFAVSPGLIRSGAVAGLGMPCSDGGSGPGGVIGPDGLAADSEWLAYARPPTGRSLGDGGALVSGFGQRDGSMSVRFETEDPAPGTTWVTTVGGWLLAAPALAVIAACSAALSPLRRARAATLHRLGLPGPAVAAVGALETASLALAGGACAAAVWALIAPRIADLPLTGLRLPNGALALGWSALALIVAGVVCAFAAASAAGIGSATAVPASHSPLSRWRIAPLAAAPTMMLAARGIGGATGLALLVASLVAGMLALPWTLPVLASWLGRVMGRSRRPALWLAGRRLMHSPVALGRPAVALGALVFVVGALSGIDARLGADDPPGRPGIPTRLDWRDSRSGDVAELRSRLPAGYVIALIDSGAQPAIVFASCADAQRAIAAGDAPCDGSALSPAAGDRIERMVGLAPRLDPAATAPDGGAGSVVVFGEGPANEARSRIWSVANATLPAVNLSAMGSTPVASPLERGWIRGAGAAGALVMLAVLLQSFADRVLSLGGQDRALRRAGLADRQIAAVRRWTLIGPSTTAVAVGTALALMFNWAGNDVDLALPVTGGILLISGTALAGVLTMIALVSGLQTSVQRRDAPHGSWPRRGRG